MCFPMSEVSRRRSDQLGNFVRVLKFRAIDLDHGAGVAKEKLGGGLHDPRLPRARRPKEQQVPHGAAWRVQSGAKHLVQVYQRLDTLFLTDNFSLQRGLEIDGVRTALAGIEWQYIVGHDRLLASPR